MDKDHSKNAISKKLSTFLKNNPSSSLEEDPDRILVVRPWNDETIGFEITENAHDLIAALNDVLLPPPLTSIYHIDLEEMEFILSVYPKEDQLWHKGFQFHLDGNSYSCRYDHSSQRLLHIAKSAVLCRPHPPTDYRNLRIYRDYSRCDELPIRHREFFDNRKPMSLFVGTVSIEGMDELINLVNHINFHVFYFDRSSPQIVIHEPKDIRGSSYDVKGVEELGLPEEIIGNHIDAYMLDLWSGSLSSSGRVAFLCYHQLLVYAASINPEVYLRLNISKVLKHPDSPSSSDASVDMIADEFLDYRKYDELILNSIIQKCVAPERVWEVISRYPHYFSSPQEFDGGFVLQPLIKADWNSEDFCTSWIPKVPDCLQKIRNALVYSKEKPTGRVISPTQANLRLVHPWVELIEEIACQVMMHRTI